MASNGFANLLENSNLRSDPYVNTMGLGNNRVAGFLWICSKKAVAKGSGNYFVPEYKSVEAKVKDDDPFYLELKPTEIILKPVTGDVLSWKCPMADKETQDCYDKIMEVAGNAPSNGLNKRLIVKGNLGPWGQGVYNKQDRKSVV